MDKKQFGEVMTLTAAAFDKQLTESLVAVYWEDLRELAYEDFCAAMAHYRRTSKWFPKISEILEYITPAEPSLEQQAVAVWDRDVFARLHDSRRAKAEDPIAERVVQDLGGWLQLGRKSVDELVWTQKEFVSRYIAYQETSVAPIRREHRLPGSSAPAQIGHILDESA